MNEKQEKIEELTRKLGYAEDRLTVLRVDEQGGGHSAADESAALAEVAAIRRRLEELI